MTLDPRVDGRIDTRVRVSAAQSANLSDIKGTLSNLGTRIDALVSSTAAMSADASQSAAGREVLRRVTASEEALGKHAKAIDDLETFRTEARTALRVLQILVAIATSAAVIAVINALAHH